MNRKPSGSFAGLAFSLLLCINLFGSISCNNEEGYEEFLWIKRLPSGHIHTRMEFLISRSPSSNINHTTMFPRALSEILTAHSVEELHVSLTQGHWRLESWGDPYPAQTAPTGAHVVAWFSNNHNSTTTTDSKKDADANWRGLTNRLSGLTCASLNFLDETTSIEPQFSYRPIGNFIQTQKLLKKNVHVRVGALPREFICTENLTPWTKLLPCGIMRGIASLLRSKQVFNTHYHSAHIGFIQTELETQLKLTLSMVFDNPNFSGQNDNFVKSVIGSRAIFPCHPAKKTTINLWEDKINNWKSVNQEDLNSLKLKDIPENTLNEKNLVFTPMKYMGGYGQEYGKMVVEMTNHLNDQFLSVLYVEVLPWYIRPYLHTMSLEVTHGSQKLPVPPGDYFHYTPGVDRKTLHKLEMDIQIPPSSKVTLSFMVEKGHLKWDEYPPDANHGFYLEAAHFEVNLTKSLKKEDPSRETRHYYSRVLLINLSTPDFSMPYNVICLTCTVVALAFGPIHNITTKRLQLKKVAGKAEKLKLFWSKIWKKKTNNTSESTEMTESESITEAEQVELDNEENENEENSSSPVKSQD